VLNDSWEIQADNARVTASASYTAAVMDAGVADGVCSVSLVPGANSRGLTLRGVSGDHYWWVECNSAGSSFALIEDNGGSLTVRASATVTLPATALCQVVAVLNADTITCVLNGVDTISYSPATFQQSATLFGLWGFQAASGSHKDFAFYTL